MRSFTPMSRILPQTEIGNARIEHFTVSKRESDFSAIRREYVPPGDYARLVVNNKLYMSDTPFEKRTNWAIVNEARGDVLIAGLGLGMILVPILAKQEVRSVTVIELHPSVIDAVAPHLQKVPGGEKLRTIAADILTWVPTADMRWDVLYFDIWADICTDNIAEVSRLHRRFARRKRPGGWMASWAHDLLLDRRREERRSGW